jgi:hypothetical protein
MEEGESGEARSKGRDDVNENEVDTKIDRRTKILRWLLGK